MDVFPGDEIKFALLKQPLTLADGRRVACLASLVITRRPRSNHTINHCHFCKLHRSPESVRATRTRKRGIIAEIVEETFTQAQTSLSLITTCYLMYLMYSQHDLIHSKLDLNLLSS